MLECGNSYAAFPVEGTAMQVHHRFDVNGVGAHAVNDGVGKAAEVEFAIVASDFAPPVRLGYDAAQRAYVLPGAMPETLNITLHGSKQSPVVNPAFVLPEWQGKASVSVKSGPLTTPVEVTLGYVEELEQVKLIAFLPITSEHDVTITIHSEK